MKKPFALLWLLAAVLVIFTVFYLPTLSRYHDLKTQQEDYDKQIAKLSKDVKEMREERDLLKNDVEYLEKVIRGELGLVKPGEIVYKFVTDAPPSAVPGTKPESKPSGLPAASASPLPVPTVGITVTAKPVALPSKNNLKSPAPLTKAPVYPRKETR